MNILVTGAAGFIGFHSCTSLLAEGHTVVGLDNINDYYDVGLKLDRLAQLGIAREEAQVFGTYCSSSTFGESFTFIRVALQDREELPKVFDNHSFDVVVNLAAQAGVRHSIDHPEAYIDGNIVGFLNVLECCRNHQVKKLVYASSSSVYGNSDAVPFTEDQQVDNPISLYAATKKSNELMAHTYTHLFGIETIGLRFFTVYGPWGRPDMAMFLFTKAIIEGTPITIFNDGNLSRDFTFIDDVVTGLERVVTGPYKERSIIYNIGNSKPVQLLSFIETLEKEIGRTAVRKYLPMQDGDVEKTWASTERLKADYDYEPKTLIENGVRVFVAWYLDYYKGL